MKTNLIPLHLLPVGSLARVKNLTAKGSIRRRMQDLGLILDTEVEAVYRSPAGDPTAYQIRGTMIALRSEEASKVLVEPVN